MNKQLFFSLLLITNTFTYGMNKENPYNKCTPLSDNLGAMVLCHDDLIPQITTALCNAHNYQPRAIKKDIATLSTTNKFLHDYFNPTTTKQNIIRLCSVKLKSNDLDIAQQSGCTEIAKKLNYFTAIALDTNKEFTKEDLKQEWYLSAHTFVRNHFLIRNISQSLLLITINNFSAKKVNDLLNNTKELRFQYNADVSILHQIIEKRFYAKQSLILALPQLTASHSQNQYLEDLLFIARRLLIEKNILVDGRSHTGQMTPLMQATYKADRPFTQLLLEFGADPHLKVYNTEQSEPLTAFDDEVYQGWLQEIINEVATSKNKTQTL